MILTGMVIKSAPAGEYDRRLVILTCERGKITAFARGARRPGSTLMAASAPFVFGTFALYEGRDAYSLVSVDVQNYFREITEDMEAACYAPISGVCGLHGRENLEAVETLKLLYQSLRGALEKARFPQIALCWAVFELKLMEINGEYMEKPLEDWKIPRSIHGSTSLRHRWKKLYTFTVTEKVLEEFTKCVAENKRRFVDKTFHSLDILDVLVYK